MFHGHAEFSFTSLSPAQLRDYRCSGCSPCCGSDPSAGAPSAPNATRRRSDKPRPTPRPASAGARDGRRPRGGSRRRGASAARSSREGRPPRTPAVDQRHHPALPGGVVPALAVEREVIEMDGHAHEPPRSRGRRSPATRRAREPLEVVRQPVVAQLRRQYRLGRTVALDPVIDLAARGELVPLHVVVEGVERHAVAVRLDRARTSANRLPATL